jgi:hypothetical protein
MKNKDLEEMMENMFLDDAPTADAVGSSVASSILTLGWL